ncbi:hypothetical protein VHA01S_031_00610 [Vibrio halioticoli NBRC 102217]|uniref:Uncharacterized protein n=1 Tax=Vibrio halioticoli NBRC 102217 TaxID=1219072 RepID=V5F484_9VIBR|nr:hypothetical protein [Vibrio halioticoli]GAD90049.1 hypothetical protein VHA01S_031_00610 [Vibrio halioticoli NBRC 102217]
MSDVYTFKGKVVYLKSVKDAADSNPLLKTYTDSFKEYWKNGYSPVIGKDVPTSFPNPPTGHRHAHLQPLTYPTKAEIQQSPHLKYSDSEDCWKEWALPMGSRKITYPTSDSCLFYMVDTERTAYVFHYQASGSHDFMKTTDFHELVHKISSMVDDAGKFLMDWDEHHTLFNKKWLESEQN